MECKKTGDTPEDLQWLREQLRELLFEAFDRDEKKSTPEGGIVKPDPGSD